MSECRKHGDTATQQGYGIGIDRLTGKSRGSHVMAWERANGERVPRGHVVRHLCGNPECVNPEHLTIGTHRENWIDAVEIQGTIPDSETKLSPEQIRAIELDTRYQRIIADVYGITTAKVNRLKRRAFKLGRKVG